MKHFLSIEDQTRNGILHLLDAAKIYKQLRGKSSTKDQLLKGQTWAMVFTKSSTRTRVSFEVGINELGGKSIFLSADDSQLGRGEPICDTARVLGRMVHGLIVRTSAHEDIEDFASFSNLPTINALTDAEHPCQIIADLMTITEERGVLEDQKIVFVGDGFSNMTRSWMWAAKHLNLHLTIVCPQEFAPSQKFLKELDAENVTVSHDPIEGIKGADVVQTDVWLSMGQEDQNSKEPYFDGYQVSESLLKNAAHDHIVMHCLPAYRKKEISDQVLEKNSNIIFQQAENRLHAQKAIIESVVG